MKRWMIFSWLLAMLLVIAIAMPAIAQEEEGEAMALEQELSSGEELGLMAAPANGPATWPNKVMSVWITTPYWGEFQAVIPGEPASPFLAFSIKKDMTLTVRFKVKYKSGATWKLATSGGLPIKAEIVDAVFSPSPHWMWWGPSFTPEQTGLHKLIFTAHKPNGTRLFKHTNFFWVGPE